MHLRDHTTLFFIRHGQTPSNRKGVEQGVRINEYLDTLGIHQVEEILPEVSPLDLDLLYTSHLYRSQQTAAIIKNHLKKPIPVLVDHRLAERDFGSLSGKTQAEIEAVLPEFRRVDILQEYDYRAFGGESVEQVRQRVLSCLLDIAQNYSLNNIGIITHAGTMRLLLFHFHEITRIYHTDNVSKKKDISNTDIYEWTVNQAVLESIRSLVK